VSAAGSIDRVGSIVLVTGMVFGIVHGLWVAGGGGVCRGAAAGCWAR